MAEKIGVRIYGDEKFRVFNMVNRRRLVMGPNTALSMNSDCDPLENVKDLISTPDKLSCNITGSTDSV